ncbi:serine/threonine-protein kinase ULK1-like [Sycon ciliatum]|uniref:serine/threonine-protein kinase ULK1-like n=1 Tax=Sycon ciliatum TaxID=27933 RepID=UPI0031F6F748
MAGLTEAHKELKNPIPVGDYYAVSFLTRGSFGQVYQGHHKDNPNQLIAIKSINLNEKSPDPATRAKLESTVTSEIGIMRRLEHKNIVNMIDVIYDEKDPHSIFTLILEYCNGKTLGEYRVQQRTLKEQTISFFFSQLSGALQYLHHKDIIHRDLKPANVLLHVPSGAAIHSAPPTSIVVKLADFGFARIVAADELAKTNCGTPLYMAPEILLGEQYDGRCDIWSMGVMIYECFCGSMPFIAHSIEQLRQKYRKGAHNPRIPKEMSGALSDLVTASLCASHQRISFSHFFSHRFLQLDAPSIPPGSLSKWAASPPKASPSVAIPRSAARETTRPTPRPRTRVPARQNASPEAGSPRVAGQAVPIPAQRRSHRENSHEDSPPVGSYPGSSPSSVGMSRENLHMLQQSVESTYSAHQRDCVASQISVDSYGSSVDETLFHPSSFDPPSFARVGDFKDRHLDAVSQRTVDGGYVLVSRQPSRDEARSSSGSSLGQSPRLPHYMRSHAAGQTGTRPATQPVSTPGATPSSVGSHTGGSSPWMRRLPGDGGTGSGSLPRQTSASGSPFVQRQSYESSHSGSFHSRQAAGPSAGSSGGSGGGMRAYQAHRNSSRRSVGSFDGASPASMRHGGGGANSFDSNQDAASSASPIGQYVSPWKHRQDSLPQQHASRAMPHLDSDLQQISTKILEECLSRCERALTLGNTALAMINCRAKVLDSICLQENPDVISGFQKRAVVVYCLCKKLAVYLCTHLNHLKKECQLDSQIICPALQSVVRDLYALHATAMEKSDRLLKILLYKDVSTEKVSAEEEVYQYALLKLSNATSDMRFIGRGCKGRLEQEISQVVDLTLYLLDSYSIMHSQGIVSSDLYRYQNTIGDLRKVALAKLETLAT